MYITVVVPIYTDMYYKMLNIAYWNIYGFSQSQNDDNIEFFSSLCQKYDVICFSETMQDSPRNLSGFAFPFIPNAIKIF